MRINADFDRRATNHAATAEWTASPSGGVERRMLDRIGGEVARATTIVRFAPGSAFPVHTHAGGEEYLVLEGDFVDEEGSHPAGTYVRNPPGTSHAPSAPEGALIYVRLSHFAPDDCTSLVISADDLVHGDTDAATAIASAPLHDFGRESLRIETWRPDVDIEAWGHGGMELFVLDGSFTESGEEFLRHSWLRLPPGERLAARAGSAGARLLVRTGHLALTVPVPV